MSGHTFWFSSFNLSFRLPSPLLALFAVYTILQLRLPPALHCPPHAAGARDTSVCVPLPNTPLFARCRALQRAACAGPACVCAPLGAGLRPLRAHAPVVGQVHGARVVHAAAAARRTRTRALPRRAAPPVCVLACGCELLTVALGAAQLCTLVASPLHQRADHTLGALAARVRRSTIWLHC